MTTPNTEPTPQEIRQFCRKSVSLWLLQLADKIDAGEIDAFDLRWAHDANTPRPIGRVISDAQFMDMGVTGMKAKPAQEPAPVQAREPERAPIPVEDLSKQLRDDLKPCADPECPNCKTKA